MLSASRDLIEWYTRRRLAEIPNVEIIDARRVDGLLPSADGRGVSGVRVRCPGEDGESSVLRAELVIDATGRRSQSSDWLARLGYERPEDTRIDAGVAYSTQTFRRPPGAVLDDGGAVGSFLQARPSEGARYRMGVMLPIEGDRWIVTLQGVGGDAPPTDDAGFLDFARALRSTILHDAIRFADPRSPAVAFANTANRRRHFERLRRWPDGFIVVGDGACAFNPIYGQGMSVAAQTAVELRAMLAEHVRRHGSLAGFAKRMQRRVARCGEAAWMIATGDDLRLPSTTGATAGAATRIQHRYLDRVMTAATNDEIVAGALLDAFFLIAPPTSLFKPSIVARVLRHSSAPSTAAPTWSAARSAAA
jgi:2-polyprenyl-6-methoxyphenol hydroxylase-like FAD-dependent oxidoreductase